MADPNDPKGLSPEVEAGIRAQMEQGRRAVELGQDTMQSGLGGMPMERVPAVEAGSPVEKVAAAPAAVPEPAVITATEPLKNVDSTNVVPGALSDSERSASAARTADAAIKREQITIDAAQKAVDARTAELQSGEFLKRKELESAAAESAAYAKEAAQKGAAKPGKFDSVKDAAAKATETATGLLGKAATAARTASLFVSKNSGPSAAIAALVTAVLAFVPFNQKKVNPEDPNSQTKAGGFKKSVVILGGLISVGLGVDKYGPGSSKGWIGKILAERAAAPAQGPAI